jgi:peptidoglycan-associated lipoprotein
MKKLIISIVLINLLAACASEKPKQPVAAEPTPVVAETAPVVVAPTPVTAEVSAPVTAAVDALNDANSILSKRIMHFPFDIDAVQDADKPAIQAHAKYLSEHADRKVRIEGNADERGSNEYNLALGQRRANSVKKMLMLGGAKASQLDSISYGEEKPKAVGHNEAAWAQNRTADLIYAQ